MWKKLKKTYDVPAVKSIMIFLLAQGEEIPFRNITFKVWSFVEIDFFPRLACCLTFFHVHVGYFVLNKKTLGIF